MRQFLPQIATFLFFICSPILAEAHGFYISDQDVAIIFGVCLAIFLAGYLPYVFLSRRLFKETATGGSTTKIKIWASIFMVINTGGLFLFACVFPVLFPISIFVWGIPFRNYIRGMRQKNVDKLESDILDA